MASPNPGLMAALLKSGRLSGAVRWKMTLSAQNVATESAASGFSGYFLDTNGVKTLTDFFSVAETQLSLTNLDLTSFENKLSTIAKSDSGAFIVWTGWQDFLKEDPSAASGIAQVFDEVASQWPGVVFIVDQNGKFENVTELTAG